MSRHDYKTTVLDPHLQKLRELVTRHRGRISGTPAGDSIMAAFWYASDAIECAASIHKELAILGSTQKVRIGIHTSRREVTPDDGLYLQEEDVIYAARIMGIAHEEQVIVSSNARENCDAKRWQWKEWRNRRVKDWQEEPQILHELLYDGVEREEPGSQFLPDWFREQNQYIPRPALEEEILNYFQKKTPAGNAARLVTLHGFGGMGKTRLAMQCCVQAASLFEGRLFCAKLDAVTDDQLKDETSREELLSARIASAFELVSNPQDPLTPQKPA